MWAATSAATHMSCRRFNKSGIGMICPIVLCIIKNLTSEGLLWHHDGCLEDFPHGRPAKRSNSS
jgi:hypothetical protein